MGKRGPLTSFLWKVITAPATSSPFELLCVPALLFQVGIPLAECLVGSVREYGCPWAAREVLAAQTTDLSLCLNFKGSVDKIQVESHQESHGKAVSPP